MLEKAKHDKDLGRKAIRKPRKEITKKVNAWLAELLIKLQEEPLAELTIDDLASLANKSKSTIYQYFQTKEDILLAACQTRIQQLSNTIFIEIDHSQGLLPKYKQMVEAFIDGISDISISFLEGIKKHYPIAWAAIDSFTDKFVKLLSELYQQGMKEGLFANISLELLAQLDKHFVSQIVTDPSLFVNKPITLSQLVKDYLTLRLTGLMQK